jgi:AcrR family transcriptional regulator
MPLPLNLDPQVVAELRRARILDGAMQAFLLHGYARTTMDDIARASEMSRPALYLVFRNKTEIYRALAERFIGRCIGEAKTALRGGEPFAERLFAAIGGGMSRQINELAASPNGAEMLDMKNALAADIIARWRDDLAEALAVAISGEASRRGIDLEARGLPATLLADLVLDGLQGARVRLGDREEHLVAVRGLVRLVDLVLRP